MTKQKRKTKARVFTVEDWNRWQTEGPPTYCRRRPQTTKEKAKEAQAPTQPMPKGAHKKKFTKEAFQQWCRDGRTENSEKPEPIDG